MIKQNKRQSLVKTQTCTYQYFMYLPAHSAITVHSCLTVCDVLCGLRGITICDALCGSRGLTVHDVLCWPGGLTVCDMTY